MPYSDDELNRRGIWDERGSWGSNWPMPGTYNEPEITVPRGQEIRSSNLLGSLDEEAMALLLQNIISAQSPQPGYEVYGLPNRTGAGAFGQPVEPGTVPSYYEPPRPAAPNPALAEMLAKLSPEARNVQQFRDLYDPAAMKRMEMLQEGKLQREGEVAQNKNLVFNQLNAALEGAQNPEEKRAIMALMTGTPGYNVPDRNPNQAWGAVLGKMEEEVGSLEKELLNVTDDKSGIKRGEKIAELIRQKREQMSALMRGLAKREKIDLPEEVIPRSEPTTTEGKKTKTTSQLMTDAKREAFFRALGNGITDANVQQIVIDASKVFYRLYGDIYHELAGRHPVKSHAA